MLWMSALGIQPTNARELVEREDALAALESAFDQAAAGNGGLVLVTAEAGGGKTALVERFRESRSRPTRVLCGACDALFTPRPLGPFHDIGLDAGDEFAALLGGGAAPYQVASLLLELLDRSAPTVLVIEDAHWADEATVDVLRLLVRRIASQKALIVVTYRDEAIDSSHPLRLMLGELVPGVAVTRVSLPPLTRDAVEQLAEPSDIDPGELYRVTGGNPFFVTEILASGGAEMPATVRDAVLARAARLTPGARTVLEAVAIAPQQAELWLVEALSGEIDGRLDECMASGMLVPTGGAVAFRHELARLAVEGSLTAARKLSLHRVALEALSARDDADVDVARAAYHADEAQDQGAVLRFAPAAGAQAASRGAHREAAEQYARALRYSHGLPRDELADLLKRYSSECYLTDQADETIDALRKARECYRELGDGVKEGETLTMLSNILWCPGRAAEALQTAAEAVEMLEQFPPGRELASAYSNLATRRWTTGDGEGAHRWGARALELAERIDDPDTLCKALFAAGGSERAERAIEIAARNGLPGQIAFGYLLLAGDASHHRAYDKADAYIDRGLTCCTEHGNHLMRLYLLALRALTELERGLWAEAAESASAVLRERMVSTFPRTRALVVLALVRARRGDPDVHPLLDEARDLSSPTAEPGRITPVAVARAEVAWLGGDFSRVSEVTGEALELAVQTSAVRAIGELQVWRRRAGIEEASLPRNRGAVRARARRRSRRGERTLGRAWLPVRVRPHARTDRQRGGASHGAGRVPRGSVPGRSRRS